MALVGQEPVLYAKSITDNIRYGLDEDTYPFAMVQEAAISANAHEFIMDMDDRYESNTGEKGLQLSGQFCLKLLVYWRIHSVQVISQLAKFNGGEFS